MRSRNKGFGKVCGIYLQLNFFLDNNYLLLNNSNNNVLLNIPGFTYCIWKPTPMLQLRVPVTYAAKNRPPCTFPSIFLLPDHGLATELLRETFKWGPFLQHMYLNEHKICAQSHVQYNLTLFCYTVIKCHLISQKYEPHKK